eukprot:14549300-Alexandrium_andersonii.AAC.1
MAPPSPSLCTDGGLNLPLDHGLAHGGSGLQFPDAPAELLPVTLSVFNICRFEWYVGSNARPGQQLLNSSGGYCYPPRLSPPMLGARRVRPCRLD